MTKPKLLLVADTFYPKIDGTLKFMEEFTRRSHKQFDISLLVPQLGSKKDDKITKYTTKTTYLHPSKRIAISGYPSIIPGYKTIKKIKTSINDNDVIFVQGPALISYLSLYYGHRLKKKTVFYTHTIAWELFEKFFPPILNKLFFNIIKKMSIVFYNYCDEILVPYTQLATQLQKEGVKTKISVARLGVDIDLFSPSKDKRLSKKKIGISPEKTVIGFVGRISKEKNTHILFEAFTKLEDQQNMQLLMVGDGPKDQVAPFKGIKNAKVTGLVHNVQQYVKAMDLFVMPSLTETTSLATLEAMSCGVPPIVTKVGYIQKYVVKDHNGLFFPRNSASMLSIKIKKLLEDTSLYNKISKNARKTVAYSFSWERSINKIKRLLLRHYFNEPGTV